MQTYTFKVTGLHCNACKMLIETEFSENPNISRSNVSLEQNTVEVEGDFGVQTPEEIAKDLSDSVRQYGYTLTI